MSELLPCPFCGGNFIVACRTNDKSKYVVMCNETDCQMEVLTDQFDTRSEAVAAWNTRTPTTSAIEAAKTAAEEILDWLNFDCALDEVKENIEAVTYIISKHLPDARAVDGDAREAVLRMALTAIAKDDDLECRCGVPPYTDGEPCPKCTAIQALDFDAAAAITATNKGVDQ